MPVRQKEVVKFKSKIRKNDQVVVVAGKSKGVQGRVLRIIADKNRVLVEGAAMIKKHVKADPNTRSEGGIISRESAIHISNVMLVDAAGKPTRVSSRVDGDKKVRVARTTGAVLESRKS